MASSTADINLTKTKKLGKYTEATESQDGSKRPHEKSRVLGTEEENVLRKCAGCGKHMRKLKSPYACPCKRAIHCSKDCLKSSEHKCKEHSHDEWEESCDVIEACDLRYKADRNANRGPSSEKITSTMTRGDHRRILRYAETGNSIASYLVGVAYAERNFDRRDAYAIPVNYKQQSIAETNEIAVKWLRVAAEGGVPEAMFLLFMKLVSNCGLWTDRRQAHYWLDQAHATGNMDYVRQILEMPLGPCDFPAELETTYNQAFKDGQTMPEIITQDDSLAQILLATCTRELKAWNGKTAMGKPFYGWSYFNSIMESIGNLKNDQPKPSFLAAEKKTIVFVSARPGFSDFTDKASSLEREENNLKFVQSVKGKISPYYQLVDQTSTVSGRTNYLIVCKHSQIDEYLQKESQQIKIAKHNGIAWKMNKPLAEGSKRYKTAGGCESCVQEAKQRLRAVSSGLFSLSLTPVFGYGYYAARYANDDGVIIQDVFRSYSKPYIRQCLMNNPHDLHPLAVAEVANLFWPIIWFWGSVYEAVRDTCNKTTLDTIFQSLGDNITCRKRPNASSMAAFPDAAAGEWRIACGNEDCPRVDHEVKFNLCEGCKVRRYCNAVCQRKDWAKHKKFCKAGKKERK